MLCSQYYVEIGNIKYLMCGCSSANSGIIYCSCTTNGAQNGIKHLFKCKFVTDISFFHYQSLWREYIAYKALSLNCFSSYVPWRQHERGRSLSLFGMLSLMIPRPSQLRPRPPRHIRVKSKTHEKKRSASEKNRSESEKKMKAKKRSESEKIRFESVKNKNWIWKDERCNCKK